MAERFVEIVGCPEFQHGGPRILQFQSAQDDNGRTLARRVKPFQPAEPNAVEDDDRW
jgi:hypothetical protein